MARGFSRASPLQRGPETSRSMNLKRVELEGAEPGDIESPELERCLFSRFFDVPPQSGLSSTILNKCQARIPEKSIILEEAFSNSAYQLHSLVLDKPWLGVFLPKRVRPSMTFICSDPIFCVHCVSADEASI